MNQTSYYVSRHSDGRDAIEIVTAAGFEDAADKAHKNYGIEALPNSSGDWILYVTHRSVTREIVTEWQIDDLVSTTDGIL